MGGKADHKLSIRLGAERQAKAPEAADALNLAAAAAGGAGHEPHALVAEYGRSIGWHDANRRDALPHQIGSH